MTKRIFSGVQPSGVLHIGNYFGAIKHWVDLQHRVDEAIFCVVDLHAITLPQDPLELKKNILSIAAVYLAAGIDPKKSAIFVQSSRPEHAELAWILNCQTYMGELARMTQYKDKSDKLTDASIPVGLFDYPVLMAADILLYQATCVPVGEDQKQHVELTRDVAERFNNKYGQTFTMPEAVIKETTARIMGLDNPLKKMSKSASSSLNYIALTDDAETVSNKIKRAVTDSGQEIKAGINKPAMTNLLNIFSEVTGRPVADLERRFEGQGYGAFKRALAEAVVEFLKPIQERYRHFMGNQDEIKKILGQGSAKVAPLAEKTLNNVKNKVGLGL